MKRFLFSFVLFLTGGCAADVSDTPVLFFPNTVKQGDFAFGFATPESDVTMNGEKIDQRNDGWFAFAVGRDEQGILDFKAVKNGRTAQRRLTIAPVAWRVQKIDGLPQNTVTPDETESKRIADDFEQTRKAREKRVSEQTPLCFERPARGRISSVYGSQRVLNGVEKAPHNALDIANAAGTPIVAPAAGIVLLAHDDMFLSGKTVLIGHGQDVATSYIHLSEISVKTGEKIEKGRQIGKMGMTGRATGPHLHWVVTWKNKRVNPQSLLDNSAVFCLPEETAENPVNRFENAEQQEGTP